LRLMFITAAHRGKSHLRRRPSMKTLLRTHPPPDHSPAAGRVRLGHMTNSLFTLQTTAPRRDSIPDGVFDFSKRRLMPPDGATGGTIWWCHGWWR